MDKETIKGYFVEKTRHLLRESETLAVLDTADAETAALGIVEGFAHALASACVMAMYAPRGGKPSERHKDISARIFIGLMACATDLMRDAAKWDASGN